MSATGKWNATVESPMGTAEIALDLTDTDGVLTGTATAQGDTVEITDGTASGNDLGWKLVVAKPMKMTLTFKVAVDGDSFEGTAKPNIFPASKVSGVRA